MNKRNCLCLLCILCLALMGCHKKSSDAVILESADKPEIEKTNLEKEFANYFFTERDDSYKINNSLSYPKVPSAQLLDRKHISRMYDGALADKNVLTIEYKKDLISVEIICPYLDTSVTRLLFFSEFNKEFTKGYYEYGEAMDALENQPFESNSKEIKIKSFMNSDKNTGYIFLDRISKTYDYHYDIYDAFYIVISSKTGSKENLMEYYDFVKDSVCY